MDSPTLKQKLIAILAADAAGFSRLMASDEHATLTTLDAARAVFRAHIESHQGRVIDMAGDSVLAAFETATGAVGAAMEIQQALELAAVTTAPDRRMQFRIGVHIGDVIEKSDGTVYGDGVNVAARLEGLAKPGGVVVSEAVQGVVAGRIGATFVDKGHQQLKNILKPIRAFAVVSGDAPVGQPAEGEVAALRDPAASAALASSALPNQSAAGPRNDGRSPQLRTSPRPAGVFVGRKPELAQLVKALAGARKGFGRVVLLAGSGGMGKTRLTQQLAMHAEQTGTLVLWGRCLEEAGAPAYWPWRLLIRSYLRESRAGDAAQTFGSGIADIAGIVPEVAEQFKLPSAPPEGDSAQLRFRLFDAIAAFWRRAAQLAPMVLIFEDLHWADATSLRLFAFLAAELDDSPILVVGTYRDTELSRQHPLFETLSDLARSPVCTRIELSGLSARETEEFMVAASGAAASATVVNALHARTEGHPLFLEETLRYMIDSRSPQPLDPAVDDPRWLTKIPTGVREVIGKRLNRLSVPAGRLLSIAACIGRDFDLHLLAQLETDKTEEDLLQALEEALSGHLIEVVAETQQFRFAHALIRETLYDEMLGVRRARLHLRIGEALEQRHGVDDAAVWPQLAYHFSEAGTDNAATKALAYSLRAARHAVRLLAFEEAARLYRIALSLLQRHFADDASQRCDVLLELGDAEHWVGSPETARSLYQQAAELARQSGSTGRFARAAIGFGIMNTHAARSGEPAVALLLEAIALQQSDDAMRVRLIGQLCSAYVYCDRADEAMEAHRRAVELARRIGDMPSLYSALAGIVAAGYWPELLQQRLAVAREAWTIAEDLEMPERIDILAFYQCDLLRAGDVANLQGITKQGLRLAEQRGAFYWVSVSRQIEVLAAIGEGRFADAESSAVLALEAGRRVEEDKAIGAYGMLMFCLRREQGRLREALPMLQQFVRDTPRTNHWSPGLALLYAELDLRAQCQAEFDTLPWHRASRPPTDGATMTIVIFVAEVCVYLGDVKRAALLYGLLEGHAGANLLADSSGPCLGSTDRLLGSLATVTKQWDAAQRHFEAALAMDTRTGWRVWLAHTRYRYAVMLHQRAASGDAERAHALLAEALVDSTALQMHALTPRIEALAGLIAAPAPAYPCGLTEREVGVLRLMAMGRNNREIGQVLAISPNTVANHVRNILEKTYTANRTEASAFASREGLLQT
jgi:class 3 adenylate cyclase/DNA-binding CsgD family transcriptional regulator/tetratricopeptide (TPR) repeat protein